MTVSSTTNRKSYAGNGVTTSFSTSPVVFFDTTDLTVYAVVTATGVSTTLVENTHYTVTGGAGSTGTVSTAGGATPYGAPASGYTLLIVRTLPVTQEVDLQNNDSSDAAVQEEAFDRGVMIDQQLDATIERSIRLADSDVSGLSLELPVVTADGFLKANAAGTAFEYVGVADVATTAIVLPVPITQGGTGAITAVLARAALGAAASGLATTSGITSATGKILGRGTAATGAVEELTPTDLTVTASAVALSTTGVSSASYTMPVVTIDSKGRAVSASQGTALGTPAATTSGTAVNLTDVAAGCKKIVVTLAGVSTNGTSGVMVQIGPSGGAVTTGYLSTAFGANSGGVDSTTDTSTAGFLVARNNAAADTLRGVITLELQNASTNTWVQTGIVGGRNSAGISHSAGQVSLAGQAVKVRLASVNGADTFDAGEANVAYYF